MLIGEAGGIKFCLLEAAWRWRPAVGALLCVLKWSDAAAGSPAAPFQEGLQALEHCQPQSDFTSFL